MPLSVFLPVVALHLLIAGRAAAAEADDGQCDAKGGCSPGVLKAPPSPYYWPMARGPIGSHSTSPYKGPRDLTTSLKWSYNRPEGKFRGGNSNGTPLIDDKGNIYTMFGHVIVKFSPTGNVLWEHPIEGYSNDIPVLSDGVLYATAISGHVLAVSMETGKLLWKSKICTWKERNPSKAHHSCDCNGIGGDIGALAANKGIVTFKSHVPMGGGACKAMAVNASTGEFLWDYATDHMVWNYYPIFTDDGESIVFQDSTGQVYRLGLDGKEIWKAGVNSEYFYQTWTDGGVQIGPNGVVYSVKALGGNNVGPGQVSAFRISDGKHLWTSSQKTPEVPNAWPVIGRMRKDDPLTVIMPIGMAGGSESLWEKMVPYLSWTFESPTFGDVTKRFIGTLIWLQDYMGDYAQIPFWITSMTPEVWGLDAETGQVLWKHIFPAWRRGKFRGETQRLLSGGSFCIPNPVGNPTLDPDGNLYMGMLDGFVYHFVRESDGPGVKVQSRFDAEGAFSSGGVSLAPGTMVIVSCDTLYVFRGAE